MAKKIKAIRQAAKSDYIGAALFKFSLDECAPVTDRINDERECLQNIERRGGAEGAVRASFKEYTDSDALFTVTVGVDPFDDESVYFEEISISENCTITETEIVERAATLAFVTRLAVSVRPTAGDRNP